MPWGNAPPQQIRLLEDADAGGLVALAPLLPWHARDVDVGRERTQRADRRLLLGRVLERVPVEEPAGVLPGDLVDLVVAAAGVLELLPGELRRLRPCRVGVRVVALPRDDVDPDAVTQQQPG